MRSYVIKIAEDSTVDFKIESLKDRVKFTAPNGTIFEINHDHPNGFDTRTHYYIYSPNTEPNAMPNTYSIEHYQWVPIGECIKSFKSYIETYEAEKILEDKKQELKKIASQLAEISKQVLSMDDATTDHEDLAEKITIASEEALNLFYKNK